MDWRIRRDVSKKQNKNVKGLYKKLKFKNLLNFLNFSNTNRLGYPRTGFNEHNWNFFTKWSEMGRKFDIQTYLQNKFINYSNAAMQAALKTNYLPTPERLNNLWVQISPHALFTDLCNRSMSQIDMQRNLEVIKLVDRESERYLKSAIIQSCKGLALLNSKPEHTTCKFTGDPLINLNWTLALYKHVNPNNKRPKLASLVKNSPFLFTGKDYPGANKDYIFDKLPNLIGYYIPAKFNNEKKRAALINYKYWYRIYRARGISFHNQGVYKGSFFTKNYVLPLENRYVLSKAATNVNYRHYFDIKTTLSWLRGDSPALFFDTLLTEHRIFSSFLHYTYSLSSRQYVFFANFGLKYNEKFSSKVFFWFFEDFKYNYSKLLNNNIIRLLISSSYFFRHDYSDIHINSKIMIDVNSSVSSIVSITRPNFSFFYNMLLNYFVISKDNFYYKVLHNVYGLNQTISLLSSVYTTAWNLSSIYFIFNMSKYQHSVLSPEIYHSFYLNSYFETPNIIRYSTKFFIYYRFVKDRLRYWSKKYYSFWNNLIISFQHAVNANLENLMIFNYTLSNEVFVFFLFRLSFYYLINYNIWKSLGKETSFSNINFIFFGYFFCFFWKQLLKKSTKSFIYLNSLLKVSLAWCSKKTAYINCYTSSRTFRSLYNNNNVAGLFIPTWKRLLIVRLPVAFNFFWTSIRTNPVYKKFQTRVRRQRKLRSIVRQSNKTLLYKIFKNNRRLKRIIYSLTSFGNFLHVNKLVLTNFSNILTLNLLKLFRKFGSVSSQLQKYLYRDSKIFGFKLKRIIPNRFLKRSVTAFFRARNIYKKRIRFSTFIKNRIGGILQRSRLAALQGRIMEIINYLISKYGHNNACRYMFKYRRQSFSLVKEFFEQFTLKAIWLVQNTKFYMQDQGLLKPTYKGIYYIQKRAFASDMHLYQDNPIWVIPIKKYKCLFATEWEALKDRYKSINNIWVEFFPNYQRPYVFSLQWVSLLNSGPEHWYKIKLNSKYIFYNKEKGWLKQPGCVSHPREFLKPKHLFSEFSIPTSFLSKNVQYYYNWSTVNSIRIALPLLKKFKELAINHTKFIEKPIDIFDLIYNFDECFFQQSNNILQYWVKSTLKCEKRKLVIRNFLKNLLRLYQFTEYPINSGFYMHAVNFKNLHKFEKRFLNYFFYKSISKYVHISDLQLKNYLILSTEKFNCHEGPRRNLLVVLQKKKIKFE